MPITPSILDRSPRRWLPNAQKGLTCLTPLSEPKNSKKHGRYAWFRFSLVLRIFRGLYLRRLSTDFHVPGVVGIAKGSSLTSITKKIKIWIFMAAILKKYQIYEAVDFFVGFICKMGRWTIFVLGVIQNYRPLRRCGRGRIFGRL